MMDLRLSLLLVFLVASCASGPRAKPGSTGPAQAATGSTASSQPTPPPTPPVEERPVEVSLQVEARTSGGQQRMIASGEALRTGDRMALHLSVNQPAYVYVTLLSAKGEATALFPKAEAERVAPDAPLRLPAAGQWYRLDEETGQENLLVYASRKPLPPTELGARVERDRAAIKAAAAASRPKSSSGTRPRRPSAGETEDAPGGLTASTRGLSVVEDEGREGDPDLKSVRFVIRHTR